MELQPGWYKVKLAGNWSCAYFDGTEFSLVTLKNSIIWYEAEELDKIGDKIEFPNE